jgi:hypothetical protein
MGLSIDFAYGYMQESYLIAKIQYQFLSSFNIVSHKQITLDAALRDTHWKVLTSF